MAEDYILLLSNQWHLHIIIVIFTFVTPVDSKNV